MHLADVEGNLTGDRVPYGKRNEKMPPTIEDTPQGLQKAPRRRGTVN